MAFNPTPAPLPSTTTLAPPADTSMSTGESMMFGFLGILAIVLCLAVIGLFIWAIISVLTSDIQGKEKVLWVMVILSLPFIGAFLWLLWGKNSFEEDAEERKKAQQPSAPPLDLTATPSRGTPSGVMPPEMYNDQEGDLK